MYNYKESCVSKVSLRCLLLIGIVTITTFLGVIENDNHGAGESTSQRFKYMKIWNHFRQVC